MIEDRLSNDKKHRGSEQQRFKLRTIKRTKQQGIGKNIGGRTSNWNLQGADVVTLPIARSSNQTKTIRGTKERRVKLAITSY